MGVRPSNNQECEDCGDEVPRPRRRIRCKHCKELICGWCYNNIHGLLWWNAMACRTARLERSARNVGNAGNARTEGRPSPLSLRMGKEVSWIQDCRFEGSVPGRQRGRSFVRSLE